MTPSRLVAMLILIAGIVVPLDAAGQPAPGMHRIGFINSGPPGPNAKNVAAFRAGMADLGYVEGRNLEIVFRVGRPKSRPASGAGERTRQRQARGHRQHRWRTDRSCGQGGDRDDPDRVHHRQSGRRADRPRLARPGGNLTGLAVLAGDLEAKRLEMLKLMLPRAKRVAVRLESGTAVCRRHRPRVEGGRPPARLDAPPVEGHEPA